MNIQSLSDNTTFSDQLTVQDVKVLAKEGVDLIVCNRPDHEALSQPLFEDIQKAANAVGITAVNIPFVASDLNEQHALRFIESTKGFDNIHLYCRTGNRSKKLWQATQEIQGRILRHVSRSRTPHIAKRFFDVVIIGAGSAGIAAAFSLLKRQNTLRITLIDPAKEHYYQPGWTMVGGGIVDSGSTKRPIDSLIPESVSLQHSAVVAFKPDENSVCLKDGQDIFYHQLIVAPGLKLDWEGVEGLSQALGSNGVTSNYRYDLAPYTWELVKKLQSGRAIFTQASNPIECAGAPQKALYLSSDHWLKSNKLHGMDVHFYNTANVLFAVPEYVPTLESYIEKYRVNVHFSHTLIRIDGANKKAWFKVINHEGQSSILETDFDMIHVCPPQISPDFIRLSNLADRSGWLDVDQITLQHKTYPNIWGLGDVLNTPNAKTIAAIRKQVPVVSQNISNALKGQAPSVGYDGYGSCPLTVERGKTVLAEFGYGGKLLPTFPSWLNEGRKATKFAWFLKANILPSLYWNAMLKGHEWLARPRKL